MGEFSARQRSSVESIRQRAEVITGEFFKVASFGPDRYLYEVVTLRDARKEERATGNFAHLIRYLRSRPGPDHSRIPGQYYRILLQDDEILESLKRAGIDFGLEELLLYILTHELIHVVRFERFLQAVEIGSKQKEEEERRVHCLTQDILSPIANKPLRAVLKRYKTYGQGLFCVSEPSEIHFQGEPPS